MEPNDLAGGTVPGESLVPVVDHGRCEAKRDCVAVCPVGAFTIRRIDPEDFERLQRLERFKKRVRRGMTAYVDLAVCESCGHCVTACPEHAITMVPRSGIG